ncbi:Uncharacterized protein BM_BM1181 [Brugia malayi]|uniref:Bm1181 n=1 Tax=Brugia malayi TaxID=6279 RepID=A0A0J9Y7J5_BRUMA|nr:Uncharacterized protein BM_BM1181 [Brugia malayi]CDQ03480.1 Bm1181 [Brugia malayi]VIO94814.1 Uncharacterized protein BM_BM1181 [Brugia malayi]
MCLHTKETTQWDVSKTCNDERKISIENIKISKDEKDKKINSRKHDADDDNEMKKREKSITKLATNGMQKSRSNEKCDNNEQKLKKVNHNEKKILKQNEVNDQLVNSFIAEFTQKSVSKSGKESSTSVKKESVIRDNTLEEIPRDMPKYNSS